MNQVLSEKVRLHSAELAVRKACEFALSEHAIDKRDVLATLLFGSRVKGFSKAGSDIDLIFFVAEGPAYPDFAYRRLYLGPEKIDSNVMKFSILNKLCRTDVDWAYRLHRACSVREFTRVPDYFFAGWMTKIEELIESGIACRFRLLRHVRECRSLLRAAQHFNEIEPGIASYLMIEAVFLLPIIYLNHCGMVPYQHGEPWIEALRAKDRTDAALFREYETLTAAVSSCELFRNLDRNGLFAREIKVLREDCRTVITQFLGDVFRDGYGVMLGAMLDRNTEAKRRISQLIPGGTESFAGLRGAIWDWLNLARRRQVGRYRPVASRTAVHRKGRQAPGMRHFHYDQELLRLKLIIPTGGCKVPTCTFCMLPSLARPKSGIDEILASLKNVHLQGPVRQLTVYTDGSFFDDRELGDGERLLIAATARELGAEELLVESLPRFLNLAAVGKILDRLGSNCQLRIGVGIQSSDALVRQYVTRTPITQNELDMLLKSRKLAPFSLRLYLLANKPMLSAIEDRMDLYRSLEFIDEWLTEKDIVTVNPLLPTHKTLLESLWNGGYWRPLGTEEVRALEADLRSRKWTFRLEFGPSSVSTCTDVVPRSFPSDAGASKSFDVPGHELLLPSDARFLPWALLGGLRHRSQWLRSGRLQRA